MTRAIEADRPPGSGRDSGSATETSGSQRPSRGPELPGPPSATVGTLGRPSASPASAPAGPVFARGAPGSRRAGGRPGGPPAGGPTPARRQVPGRRPRRVASRQPLPSSPSAGARSGGSKQPARDRRPAARRDRCRSRTVTASPAPPVPVPSPPSDRSPAMLPSSTRRDSRAAYWSRCKARSRGVGRVRLAVEQVAHGGRAGQHPAQLPRTHAGWRASRRDCLAPAGRGIQQGRPGRKTTAARLPPRPRGPAAQRRRTSRKRSGPRSPAPAPPASLAARREPAATPPRSGTA